MVNFGGGHIVNLPLNLRGESAQVVHSKSVQVVFFVWQVKRQKREEKEVGDLVDLDLDETTTKHWQKVV